MQMSRLRSPWMNSRLSGYNLFGRTIQEHPQSILNKKDKVPPRKNEDTNIDALVKSSILANFLIQPTDFINSSFVFFDFYGTINIEVFGRKFAQMQGAREFVTGAAFRL